MPSSRIARLGKLGSLASRVAGGMLAEGAAQLAAGKRPKLNEILLTPNNVKRVADQLAKLRGAAMKVGQLMSMDAGEMLPKEVSELLARLRAELAAGRGRFSVTGSQESRNADAIEGRAISSAKFVKP